MERRSAFGVLSEPRLPAGSVLQQTGRIDDGGRLPIGVRPQHWFQRGRSAARIKKPVQ